MESEELGKQNIWDTLREEDKNNILKQLKNQFQGENKKLKRLKKLYSLNMWKTTFVKEVKSVLLLQLHVKLLQCAVTLLVHVQLL